ncbi:ComF family protein [Methylobacterium haplocladii]|uniref:Amidophosphoribosyltransferase n=1 Tax=Methylobacterium haplocladii TaxID=1176176 RepID=A0A512IS00_9HYPH|nr:ComF family protein [Methylobacterium haplocladii]GEP00495.1 amidophosphoribosyltransferase [Methylobacterium haplocladii]GJD82483.1 Putative ribose-phosphate pyrophosphokinase [Methylobacterium haplocladii]GLS59568.1 amidophosphoribosyltransferase [Methylobacterium haplocladii]
MTPLPIGAVSGGLRAAFGAALGLVYPPTCIGCGGATAQPHALCSACWSGLRLIERPFCERLGTPFALDLGVGALLSPRAIADPPVYQRARAVALYDGTARDLVHRLNYGDRLDLGRAMARMMTSSGAELIADADLVVPVPLHAFRLWRRRFNQAALLAREVARVSGVPCDVRALTRVKRTRPQVGLTRTQRATNLQGAFRVPESARSRLAGRHVVLIDDVTTTGATGNAASRALLRGGARQVDLLTFATVSAGTE